MKKQIKFPTRINQYLVLIIFLLTGMMMFGSDQTSSAQVIRTRPTPTPQVRRTPPPQRKALIFKGTGEEKARPEIERFKNLPKPITLSPVEKQNLFNKALLENGYSTLDAVLPYALLTPSNPFVEGRAGLNFYNASTVSSHTNTAEYGFEDGTQQGSVVVFINHTKIGQWFMIDCIFYSPNSRKFSISSQNGQKFEETVDGMKHLQAFLVTTEYPPNGKYYFSFSTAPGGQWLFYSCEVTTPN
jgi:hypothetical protein